MNSELKDYEEQKKIWEKKPVTDKSEIPLNIVATVWHSAREHGICYSCKFEKLIIPRIIDIQNEVKFCILKKIRLIRNNKRSVWFFSKYKILFHSQYS